MTLTIYILTPHNLVARRVSIIILREFLEIVAFISAQPAFWLMACLAYLLATYWTSATPESSFLALIARLLEERLFLWIVLNAAVILFIVVRLIYHYTPPEKRPSVRRLSGIFLSIVALGYMPLLMTSAFRSGTEPSLLLIVMLLFTVVSVVYAAAIRHVANLVIKYLIDFYPH